MNKIINKNSIIFAGLLALALIIPVGLVSAQGASPAVSYPTGGSYAYPGVSNVGTTSVTLSASVNPNGSSTDVWFELNGVTGSLGFQNIGSGNSNVTVTYNVTGLSANTSYSFRAVASNTPGTTNGSPTAFVTASTSKPVLSSVQTLSITQNSATLSAKVNPKNSSTEVWFEVSNTNGTLGFQNIGSGSSDVTATYNLTGLSANTEYSWRIVADNALGMTPSEPVTFRTSEAPAVTTSAPSITTSAASSVSDDSAKLNATYNGNGATAYVSFAYGTSSSNLNNYTSYQSVGSGSGSTNQTISGLTANTTYYFRAQAYNGVSSSSSSPILASSILRFTTDQVAADDDASDPVIPTASASGITQNSAILNGTFNGNGDGTYVRFAYGTSSSSLTNKTSYAYQGPGTGSFSQSISGLTADTTYYFKAEGYNGEGSDEGTVGSFKTLAQSTSNSGQFPTTVTKQATNAKETSVTFNGQAVNTYALPVTAWFEYGTTLSLGSQTSKQSAGSGTAINLSSDVTGLKKNTIYYFRAVAENAGGNTFGDIMVTKTGNTVSVTNTVTSGNTAVPSTTSSVSENGEALSIKIETKSGKLIPGASIEYFVNYKNNADKNIKNVVLRVTLPKNVVFTNATNGSFRTEDNTLVINNDVMSAGEEKVVYIQAKIGENAQSKESLLTTVTANYKNGSKTENVLAFVVGEVGSAGAALAAAAIFGESGILPNTPVEWIVLAIVIAGLVILGRKIYIDNEKKKIKAAMPSNLPGAMSR